MRKRYPLLGDALLMGTITYDTKGKRLVKSYRENFAGKVPREYLRLDPPQKTPEDFTGD